MSKRDCKEGRISSDAILLYALFAFSLIRTAKRSFHKCLHTQHRVALTKRHGLLDISTGAKPLRLSPTFRSPLLQPDEVFYYKFALHTNQLPYHMALLYCCYCLDYAFINTLIHKRGGSLCLRRNTSVVKIEKKIHIHL